MLGLTMHHIGVACKDIEAASEHVKLCYDVTSDSGRVYDPGQRAELRLFGIRDGVAIELVAGPVVENLLARRTTYYHVCYATPDIDATIRKVRDAGGIVISGPTPAVLFANKRVAFVHTLLGIVEFLEL